MKIKEVEARVGMTRMEQVILELLSDLTDTVDKIIYKK